MYKLGQSGGFFGTILGPVLTTRLSLIGNVLKPLVLITDAAIHKTMFRSGFTILAIFNKKWIIPWK